MAVDISGGAENGYVVLRRPLGPPDTVLVPTRKIAGAEDPSLTAQGTPNYFALAWSRRQMVAVRPGQDYPSNAVALAVNSRFVRTQDQLHIHIGCLHLKLIQALKDVAPKLEVGRWTNVRLPGSDDDVRVTRVVSRDLTEVNPFQIAKSAFEHEVRDAGDLLIAVARLDDATKDGAFAVLAAASDGSAPSRRLAADDLMEAACPADD